MIRKQLTIDWTIEGVGEDVGPACVSHESAA